MRIEEHQVESLVAPSDFPKPDSGAAGINGSDIYEVKTGYRCTILLRTN